jgi:hypothetical protein
MVDVSRVTKDIYLWHSNWIHTISQKDLTEGAYSRNFLYQLMFFDKPTFILMIMTAEERREPGGEGYTYDDLVNIVKKYNYFANPEDMVLKGLDTLLDFAIYKPKWSKRENHWRRVFFNRSEVVRPFYKYKDKLFQPTKDFVLDEEEAEIIKRLFEDTLLHPLEEPLKKPLKERIERIERDIFDFLSHYLEPACKEHNALIIPTMRKGAVLLQYLCKKYNLELDAEYSGYYGKDKLDKRYVILFDDAVEKGDVLKEYLNLLTEELKINRDNISFAAYCINNERCPQKIKDMIDIGPPETKRLNDVDFRREVSDIMLLIASLGQIIDPDHLVIEAKYKSSKFQRDIMSGLKKLGVGEIFEPNLDYLYPYRKKITLNLKEEGYRTLVKESNLPIGVEKIDIAKIRFLFNYDYDKENNAIKINELSIIPIVNPTIRCLNLEEQSKVLEKYENFGRVVKSENYFYGTPPYVDIIIYDMTTSLIKAFLEKCSQEIKGNIELENVLWNYYSSKYKDQNFDELLLKFKSQLEQIVQ